MVYLGKTNEKEMFFGASPETYELAKSLRKKMTDAEKALWQKLKNRKINGLKFRRQHPVNYYIADFYCHEKNLIIELDGKIHEKHDQKDRDEGRTGELEKFDIMVIRFKNEEVLKNVDKVIDKIVKHTTSP